MIVAVATLFVTATEPEQSANDESGASPLDADYDYYVEDMRTTRFGADGQALSQLQAARVTHYPDGDRAELAAPMFRTFGAAGDTWQVGADAGTLAPYAARAEDRLDLVGNVQLQKPQESGDFVEVRTSALTVFIATEEVVSTAPVTVQTRGLRHEGVGMRALLAENYIKLNDGKGTYDPSPNP